MDNVVVVDEKTMKRLIECRKESVWFPWVLIFSFLISLAAGTYLGITITEGISYTECYNEGRAVFHNALFRDDLVLNCSASKRKKE